MAPNLIEDATTKLKVYLDKATTGDIPILPGAILHVVDASNNTVFTHASGGPARLSESTLTMIHSCTKIVGAIAFMQLVDRGLISLDDASLISDHLPELASKKVLTRVSDDDKKTPILVPMETQITPRMLMNHTNGTGHTYFNQMMREYLAEGWETRNEVADPHQTVLDAPLLWQPGTHTNYAQGFDWLAVLVERITRTDLATYLQEHIFAPLGITDIAFEESYGGDATTKDGSKGRFWPRSLKQPDGTFIPIDLPTIVKVPRAEAYPAGKYHAYPLGTGLVASAASYARLLTIFLNAGRDPLTGHVVLSPASTAEITKPQLPPHLRNDSRVVPSALDMLCKPAVLDAQYMDPEGSFGLGCGVQGAERTLADGRRGRGKGSVYWYSAANMDFWVDKERGVVVVVNGNFFPWNDVAWIELVAGIEGVLYEGLED
ncbi:beta-lactamase family protein [Paraphaeosphaeria sporulosa]|uniref:Beta-lactamase family protein n=1 Tax=Paraphaeosphaeria sporulosa TaxID=1460663 RepID=A0A177CWB5_9PLEO|nr:beta-lactamase family protein [Paraphaeosphaeria sporulosa]OAG11501.1 beta-lactamase family protein [Paraphaeosphaeria sporulosa]